MSKREPIQKLPDEVINKIAAGEVVERPASVVKELLENARDAGATQIDIHIERGGIDLIRIIDNGWGMSKEQACLSLERHATSKIQSEADIEEIQTLGFRGEALAAIASVSQLSMTTRPETHTAGTQITLAGGTELTCQAVGAARGTTIEVRHLFYNVPARRKFLRAPKTELNHIRQLVLLQALSAHQIGFSLTAEGHSVYQLPRCTKPEERIAAIYSPAFLSQLRPIAFHHHDLSLSGFTGLPQTGRKDRQDQFVFINGRAAAAPIIYHAINEVYRPLLGRGRYPALFLSIEMPPDAVDVNVHPAKKEVRFRYPNQIRDAIQAALQDALHLQPNPPQTAQPFSSSTLPPAKRPAVQVQDEMSSLGTAPASHSEIAIPEPAPSSHHRPPWTWCRMVGQLGGQYVVLETEEGFILMEPRAAHERVLYEKYLTAIQAADIPQQTLLHPESIPLQPADFAAVEDGLHTLRALGFGLSVFGKDTFLVDALPALLQNQPVEPLLLSMAHALTQAGKRAASQELLHEHVAQAACRGAVRHADPLNDAALEKLVEDLSHTTMPYASPSGKPTLLFTSYTELATSFKKR
jgi:DNA mismatch repair protein MutL